MIMVPTLATSRLLRNQRPIGSSGSAKILRKFCSVIGSGIHLMGRVNWFTSSVNAIITMYSTGMKMMNTSGRKISHIRSDRLTYLSFVRLLTDG
jgi:hypothetical protein